MSTLVPSFEFKLDSSISPGMVCVGKFDGTYPCLAAATPNGNVLLHDPRAASNAVRTLSFGRSIRGLSCISGAALATRKEQQNNNHMSSIGDQSAVDRDMLLLGSDTSAHVFDVHTNSDQFFKDVPDGVCCCALGTFSPDSAASEPMIVVGSNCSIQGFAGDGSECFWTVSGDSVTCIAFAYLDSTLMLVGSKDSFVRAYFGEQLIHEISETAAPTCIKVITKPGHTQFDSCKWL
jgi:Bardet-Biedl syndrome 2 protein